MGHPPLKNEPPPLKSNAPSTKWFLEKDLLKSETVINT